MNDAGARPDRRAEVAVQKSETGSAAGRCMADASVPLGELLQRGYRYALALTHDVDAAQELLQDACVSVSRRGGPWRSDYLITVIRNRHIDQYRRGQILKIHHLGDLDPAADDAGRGDSADPELASALARLRTDEREMLYLAAVDGYTAEEIARLTDRPRGTVLSTIHRAKRKLRDALTPDESRKIS